jgi:hypothetical protein
MLTLTTTAPTPAGDFLAQVWQPSCPSPQLVAVAASMFPAIREAAGPTAIETEGPRWEIVIAPGAIQVRTRDWARGSRYQEREARRQAKEVDQLAGWLADRGEFPADREPSREIIGWSRASRANMVKTLCQLDYTPLFADPTRLPAMLTLTYPGDWLTVAPNGKAVKSHLKTLRKRYRRAWREDLACVWKLEFQRRGAPHIHMLIVPPHGVAEHHSFRQWISTAWADVVNHPDPTEHARHVLAGTGIDWTQGLRSTDPKRVAVYFTKHGAFAAKEYQHCVPQAWQTKGRGPGRFWGYWVLRPARAGVQVLPAVGLTVGRLLRRWARAQGTTRQTTRMRVNQTTGRIRYRNSRVRVRRLLGCRGWVSVNDGAVFAAQIARYLDAQT